jgi:hypothetical protein
MSDLYSVIPGLQPTAQELLEGELLCKQILEAKFPELELREGTGLRDLVIRPSAMLLALINKAANYYFTQNTLTGVTNDTPTEVLDAILSNWFLNRNLGTKSTISARLYFARKKNVAVSSDNFFSPDNTLKFFPPESISYSAESLAYDSYSNEYYIDVDMVAEKEGTEYNISSGSLLYFANFDPYFLRAEINYLKSESISSETNSEFIERSKSAISTRNLINAPSIDARLREAFNYITRLLTIGMGDPEMVRDKIKVIFEDQYPRLVEHVSREGYNVTVTMSNHGYTSGQVVRITDAIPEDYNGDFPIDVEDDTTFTYTITTTPGSIITVPNVVAVNAPVYIHNGGMVDIYCSDKLATSSIQLTTDDFGRAEITGPVYEVERSDLSAGDSEDSIPVKLVRQIAAINFVGATANAITTVPHEFEVGDIVTISGATQIQETVSLTSTGIVATVVLPFHNFQAGNMVTITGASPDSYNGTYEITSANSQSFTFNLKGPINTGATGRIYAEVNLLNKNHIITAASGNTFSVELPQVTTAPVYGNIEGAVPVQYKLVPGHTYVRPVMSIYSVGTEVTVGVVNHGYTQGRYIIITDCEIPQYNGTWYIKNIVSENQFQFDIDVLDLGGAVSGNVTAVNPSDDNGFSQRQVIYADFGGKYANQTASFKINYIQNLDSIQTYLDSPTNRVICADYLARGFNFYKLKVEVTSYDATIPDATLADTVIRSYLTSLAPGENFVMSDMVSNLRQNGITNIQNPPKVTYKKYTRDLMTNETGTITDILDPNDRTSVFLLDDVSTFSHPLTITNTAFKV